MVASFPTTLVVIAWSVSLSFIWLLLCFYGRRFSIFRGLGVAIPSLVIVPFLIVVAHRAFEINLIFPVFLESQPEILVIYTMMPAWVLLFASGLMKRVSDLVSEELLFWSRQPCSLFSTSLGQSQYRSIAKVVLIKSFLCAWSQSLPWYFGEMIVVESLFNAPGIGMDIWHAAKQHDFQAVGLLVSQLMILYLVVWAVLNFGHRWLGRRLETYS